MLIHEDGLFAMVIPTFDGTPFLKRTLDYFRDRSFQGRIVLCDNSSGYHRMFVAACVDEYADLQIETFQFEPEIRFLDKLVRTLEEIDCRFVMLHAHDDFMIPACVERCVGFLDQHPAYTAARGRMAMLTLARSGGDSPPGGVSVSLSPHPMRAYEQDDPVERVLAHIERYASVFYSVHRREALIESFRITEADTRNVIFFQYLSSCISALQGKIRCLDELFYVRQGHADSWSGSLRQGSYEHWPMLITSPNFSRYYEEFRSSVCRFIQHKLALPADDVGPRVDAAAVGLFLRGYCGKELDNPEEARFFERLKNGVSEEARLVDEIVAFAVRYPETC